MKTLVLYYTGWPNRELQSAMMDVHGEFEARGEKWVVTRKPEEPTLFVAVHAKTGYIMTGVLKATAEDVITEAKDFLKTVTEVQLKGVLRAVKEATGAPLE